jgi:hypothetical protein
MLHLMEPCPTPVKIPNVIRRSYSASRAPGWQVTIKRDGKIYGKYFSDRSHGGTDQALAEAVRYRDHLLSILPPDVRFFKKHKRNTSGQVGILFAREKSRVGNYNPYYVAVWHEEGKRRVRKFSVTKYGKEEAFQMAVDARSSAFKKLVNTNSPQHKIDCFHISALGVSLPFA